MKIDTFLLELQEILQRDQAIKLDDSLSDMEEWDSLAIMALIAWFGKHLDLALTFNHFKDLKTVADVASLSPAITL